MTYATIQLYEIMRIRKQDTIETGESPEEGSYIPISAKMCTKFYLPLIAININLFPFSIVFCLMNPSHSWWYS